MRIRRDKSRLTFRKRRQRPGCLPFVMLIGVLVAVSVVSWELLGMQLGWRSDTNPPPDLSGAESAFANGDLDEVVARLRDILAKDPNHVGATALLARTLVYRSYTDYNRGIDRQLAQQLASLALDRQPGNLDLMAIFAFTLQANGQSENASRMALRVIEQRPEDVTARITLGLAYGGQGLFEAGLRENLRAVELATTYHPNWRMDSYRALAIAYSDLGRYADAIKAIDAAAVYNPRMIPLQFERALYALQLSQGDAATAAYFQVLAVDPDNAKARLRLCELSSSLRERETAERYCTEVTELAPTWSDGWYQLGREYFLQGEFESAQQAFHQCSSLQVMQDVPISERRFECWYLQGQAAEILGDCEGLLTTYNEFLAMRDIADIPETWTYPPEGPTICRTETTGSP